MKQPIAEEILQNIVNYFIEHKIELHIPIKNGVKKNIVANGYLKYGINGNYLFVYQLLKCTFITIYPLTKGEVYEHIQSVLNSHCAMNLLNSAFWEEQRLTRVHRNQDIIRDLYSRAF